MNDDHPPIPDESAGAPLVDDDLVSAVLDGEATPDERAVVEGSPEGRRRLEELRAAALTVAEAVPPLEGATTDALIARALAAAATPVGLESSSNAPPVAADELVARRRRRDGGQLWRRIGTAVAAVAAVVVVVAGIAALARSGRSSSDSASSGSADATRGTTSEQLASGAAGPVESYAPANGVTPPELGTLPDAAAVLDRYVVLLAVQPSIDHQFDGSGSSSSGAAPAPSPSPEVATRSLESCPVPPVPPSPGETWTVTATGLLPGGPVLVMSDGLAPPTNRVLVVDASTCVVLAERTI